MSVTTRKRQQRTQHPGVIIACTAVAAITIAQSEDDGERVRNDRLIVIPAEDPIAEAEHGRRTLTRRRREEIEEFIRAASLFEGKNVEFLSWVGEDGARRLVSKTSLRGPSRKR